MTNNHLLIHNAIYNFKLFTVFGSLYLIALLNKELYQKVGTKVGTFSVQNQQDYLNALKQKSPILNQNRAF